MIAWILAVCRTMILYDLRDKLHVLEFTDCVRRLERMRQVKMNDYTLQNIEFRIVVGHVG